jgi:hypothetical protein
VDVRQAEDRHSGITDELLDHAAMPLDDGAELAVIAAHQLTHELGVRPFAERSRPNEVAEDDGHGLPDVGRRRCSERRAAVRAETRVIWVFVAAGSADHGRSVHHGRRRFKPTVSSPYFEVIHIQCVASGHSDLAESDSLPGMGGAGVFCRA